MLVYGQGVTIHPMHIANVEDTIDHERRVQGCKITMLTGEVFDLDLRREDFDKLWREALSHWCARPPQKETSKELSKLMERANG